MEDIFHLGIKALIRNSVGQILLLKVNPKKLIYRDDWKGIAYWDVPGGRIKKDASVEETLKIEIEEEIGVKEVTDVKPFSMVLSKIRIPQDSGSVGLILGAYTCQIPDDIEIKISDEHVEYKWFSSTEVSKLLEVKYPVEFTEKIKSLSV